MRILFVILLWGAQSLWASKLVDVAVVGPRSGPVTEYGDMQFTGARYSADDINHSAKQTVQLNLIAFDDACDPQQAIEVAKKIVQSNIHYVIGHLCSSATQVAAPIYEANNVLMITPASTSPTITQQGYRLVFRTIGLDSKQGSLAAEYIKRHNPKSLAIIHDQQQYGKGVAEAVKTTLMQSSFPIKLMLEIDVGRMSFKQEVEMLKAQGIDFIYYGGYYPELAHLLRQSKRQGLSIEAMGPEAIASQDIMPLSANAADGLLVTLPPAFSTWPEAKQIVERLQQKQLDEGSPFIYTSYAAIQVLAQAISVSESSFPVDIATTLRQKSFDTLIGPLSFNDAGDLNHFKFEVFRMDADGKMSKVFPP
ncbi:ABC transporter substrate-binding protein [Zooshikella ganghwensis]|uniref:ABC transporter substrate-binding protein n=1 Tax=Zooshikella ganghwensis TaxID=202772 RepID=UPI00040F8F12|nr:ABC transporter substrate-binding protein [Zooshikella ganghwensis]